MLLEAIEYAVIKHGDQKRDDGSLYVLHPIRVAKKFPQQHYRIVSILHDVLEDTDATFVELCDLFGPNVANDVLLLTKMDNISYREYYDTIRESLVAFPIKIADRIDNLRSMTVWPEDKQKRYLQYTVDDLYGGMSCGCHNRLMDELAEEVQFAEERLGVEIEYPTPFWPWRGC